MMPFWIPTATACVRFAAPSFFNTFFMWKRTVSIERPISLAISLSVQP
jgi:hypothetical protein